MKIRRRTEVIYETREVLALRRRYTEGWCDQCRTRVRMMRPEEAAAATGANLRRIFRQIEALELHFKETEAGNLLICLNSLLDCSHQE